MVSKTQIMRKMRKKYLNTNSKSEAAQKAEPRANSYAATGWAMNSTERPM